MVFRRDEISNMWVPDIQHEAHDAPFHVRIDASFKQDTKGITNAGRWRLIASASARDWLREGDHGCEDRSCLKGFCGETRKKQLFESRC